MGCPQNTDKFKGIFQLSNPGLSNEIENALEMWSDWAFLSIGGWQDVVIPTTGIAGGYNHILRMAEDKARSSGQVWEGFRKDWVHETGVEFDDAATNPDPINITGIQVDGTMYPSGDATYGWYVNYPEGQVVFDSALPTTSDVQANYSFRSVQVYKADNAPWFQQLHLNSFAAESIEFTQDEMTGDWSIGSHHRIQLPAVVIEIVPKMDSKGYELGNGSLWTYQDVLFHVIAENRFDRNNILDVYRLQKDKTIWLMDTNEAANSGVLPLDYLGRKVNSINYPDLVASYKWKKCHFEEVRVTEVNSLHPNLHEAVVRATLSVVYGDM